MKRKQSSPGVRMLRRVVVLVLGLTVAAAGQRMFIRDHIAYAATFTVNSTADIPDVNPGDGRCETAVGSGVCTLRAAIMEANAKQDADSIALPAGTFQLNRPLNPDDDFAVYGDLDITNTVTIGGAGTGATIIDGAGATRIFDISGPVTVALASLTIRNGGDGDGAAIRNAGTLTLTDVALVDNVARASGGAVLNTGAITITGGTMSRNNAGRGGAMTNLGSVTITGTEMTGNTVWRYGGALTNDPESFMTLTNVTVTKNVGGFCCGGIANGGTLTITSSRISENKSEFGGGVTNNHRHAAAVITASIISGNQADDGGGGIVNQGTLTVTNSTISGNRAGRNGGGLYNGIFNGEPSSASLISVTLAGNDAPNGGAIFNDDRTGVQLRNTLIARGPTGANCAGAMTSLGHNLEDGTSCNLQGIGDITSREAGIGPLADNGGNTQTHNLLPNSPAIDAGDTATCPQKDQRDQQRPQGAACDIGAIEVSGAAAQVSRWAERPPATGAPTPSPVCPGVGGWFLLYWAGSANSPISTAAGGCANADFYWVSRDGKWLGYTAMAPAASDTWDLLLGEAHFVHGR